VFEGQRAYAGEIFRLTDHSRRLQAQRRAARLRDPVERRGDRPGLPRGARRQRLEDAYMRPLAWRGSEQMGVSAQRSKIHLAIACWPWGAYFGEEAIRKGLRLDISKWRRPAPYTAPTESKASGLYMIAGASPSGKAPVFGTGIRRFESCRPSQRAAAINSSCRRILWSVHLIA
jgi:branched-chain amino acid aminotransferase